MAEDRTGVRSEQSWVACPLGCQRLAVMEPVRVHSPRVTVRRNRRRYSSMRADPADTGSPANPESDSVSADRRAQGGLVDSRDSEENYSMCSTRRHRAFCAAAEAEESVAELGGPCGQWALHWWLA
jgi:hypothetical protein